MTLPNRLLLAVTLMGFVAGCGQQSPPVTAPQPPVVVYQQSTNIITPPQPIPNLPDHDNFTKLPVESFRLILLEPIQKEIQAARQTSQAWVNDSLQIAQHFAPAGKEWRGYYIRAENNDLSSPTETTVTVILYGLGDHLTVAERNDFVLVRKDRQQPWGIQQWRRSYLDHGQTAFTASSVW